MTLAAKCNCGQFYADQCSSECPYSDEYLKNLFMKKEEIKYISIDSNEFNANFKNKTSYKVESYDENTAEFSVINDYGKIERVPSEFCTILSNASISPIVKDFMIAKLESDLAIEKTTLLVLDYCRDIEPLLSICKRKIEEIERQLKELRK